MAKVVSSEQTIYKTIEEQFYASEQVVISKVIVPENVFNDYFAVFHTEGITIYDVSEEHRIVEFGSLDWEEFPYMTVRFFKYTTNLIFHADEKRFRKLTLNDDRREAIIDFVQENTPAQLEIVQLKWYNNIPGFRSGTRWKMIMSSIVYLWILGIVFNIIIG